MTTTLFKPTAHVLQLDLKTGPVYVAKDGYTWTNDIDKALTLEDDKLLNAYRKRMDKSLTLNPKR